MYPNSNISIVVEILQSAEPSILEDAIRSDSELVIMLPYSYLCRFHFDSLAHDNDATFSEIQEIFAIPNGRGDETPSVTILFGEQHVAKFNPTEADHVRILMALYRIEKKNVDLIVTFNVPVKLADGGAIEEGFQLAKRDFETFVRSLQIIDFDLFA